jgi:hypothetical protein
VPAASNQSQSTMSDSSDALQNSEADYYSVRLRTWPVRRAGEGSSGGRAPAASVSPTGWSKGVVLRVGGRVMFAREEVTGGPLPRGRKAGVQPPACKQGGVHGGKSA